MSRCISRLLLCALLGSCFPLSLAAEVVVPKLFSDHMVLQRNLPIHVWGTATAGEAVSVTFRGETRKTATDVLGRWSLYLEPANAGGPYTLSIQGTNTITFQDVLIGDIWVASGQSNMEFPMTKVADSEKEIAAARYPQIRLLHIEKKASDYALSDVSAKSWSDCTPESVPDFSAVAYFFAREIQQREHVPIGVIESSWGGTPAEAWTSLAAISADASLMPVFSAYATMTDKEEVNRLEAKQEQKEIEEAKTAGHPIPQFPWHPPIESWKPGALYNGMIAPLVPFPIRGVIWYQGESNSLLNRASWYDRIFPTMIQDWRACWSEGDFPFLFVQIANFTSTTLEDWPTVREAQRKTLALRNTAMAVTIDIVNPDDVHPIDKQDVGARLAVAARAVAYGEKIEYSGPLYRVSAKEGKSIRIWFDHAESGVIARHGKPTGFEIAGVDGKFVPADAQIEGATILVSSPNIQDPKSVRYGWSNSPECNLYNKEGLPASPFRTE